MGQTSNLLRFGAPIVVVALVIVILIARVGAGNNDESDIDHQVPDGERQIEEINIESFEVHLAESFPVQVFVEVEGYLPDPCWEPQEPTIERDGNRFIVTILAERDPEEMCPQVIEEYSETVPLGNAEPGSYAVEVNGVEQAFEVD
jgi:hypothetical protein